MHPSVTRVLIPLAALFWAALPLPSAAADAAPPAPDPAGPAPEAAAEVPEPAPAPEATANPPSGPTTEELEERIAALEDQLELMEALSDEGEAPSAPTLPTFLNAMNPRLTVFGDLLGRLDTAPVTGEEGRVDNLFLLRETEIDFRASADPFVEGVVILAIEGAPDGSFEFGVEEGYALVKRLNLPLLHDPPLGLSFKVGRFRAAFGRLNQTHTHDLPQSTYPLALQQLLGPEGLAGTGVSIRGFLPLDLLDESSTLLFAVEGFGGEIAGSPHGSHLVAMLDWTRPLGQSHLLELTAMGEWGKTLREDRGPADRTLGANFFYQWRPAGASSHRSLILSAGYLRADRHQASSVVSQGLHAFVQGQVSRSLFLGVRYDQSQSPEDPAWSRSIYPYFSWYSSEFFRLRIGWQHTFPESGPDTGTLLAQINFIFGSHPPEPFWVSR